MNAIPQKPTSAAHFATLAPRALAHRLRPARVKEREKLILDWRTKEQAKAAIRETIREELDALPDVYERRLWEEKVERTYQFVFEHFDSFASIAAG